MELTEEYMKKLLKEQICCGKKMKMNEFYSQGIMTYTAVCRKCGNYKQYETGKWMRN